MSKSAPLQHELVVIGVSTGGPKALQAILPQLPGSFPVPIVVVQHIGNAAVQSLVNTLEENCQLPVSMVTDSQILAAGVHICPAGYQCRIDRIKQKLRALLIADETSTYRPSINPTMRSAAKVCGCTVIGVLLTGMGSDGVKGLKEIHDSGGLTIVESSETATIFGMPGEALRNGVVQRVLPLHQISAEILMACSRGCNRG
jgi:two-component system chemotaxis response regulator CheB